MLQTQTLDHTAAIRELELGEIEAVSGGFDWFAWALKFMAHYTDGLSSTSMSFPGGSLEGLYLETSWGGVGAIKFDVGKSTGFGVGIRFNL